MKGVLMVAGVRWVGLVEIAVIEDVGSHLHSLFLLDRVQTRQEIPRHRLQFHFFLLQTLCEEGEEEEEDEDGGNYEFV